MPSADKEKVAALAAQLKGSTDEDEQLTILKKVTTCLPNVCAQTSFVAIFHAHVISHDALTWETTCSGPRVCNPYMCIY